MPPILNKRVQPKLDVKVSKIKSVAFTEAELEKIKYSALARGMSATQFIREIVNQWYRRNESSEVIEEEEEYE